MMDIEITGKNGDKRRVEQILGRQKLKKGFQYEVKFKGMDHRHNAWLPREDLLKYGFQKMLTQFDDMESSREGAGARDLSAGAIRKLFEEVGLDPDIAQYNEISGLSGGQKVKVVICASLINSPQVLVVSYTGSLHHNHCNFLTLPPVCSSTSLPISWTEKPSEDCPSPSETGQVPSVSFPTTSNSSTPCVPRSGTLMPVN